VFETLLTPMVGGAMALHWVRPYWSCLAGCWASSGMSCRADRRATPLGLSESRSASLSALVVAQPLWRLSEPSPAPEQSRLGVSGAWTTNAVHLLICLLLIAVPAAAIVAAWRMTSRRFMKPSLMALVDLHAAATLVHHHVFGDRTLLRILPGASSAAAS